MNVGGVNTNYPIGYEARRTQRSATEKSYASNMGKTAGTNNSAFVLHTSNEEDGIAIGSSTDRNGSVTVYKPNDFDPANPVYKVKAWDAAGNVTEERMVDVSKVDPNNCDYLDMYAYSCHLTDSGECPGAQDAFMGAHMGAKANDSEGNVSSYFDKINWVNIIRDIMQMQYDAGNLTGYMRYKQFRGFLEQ